MVSYGEQSHLHLIYYSDFSETIHFAITDQLGRLIYNQDQHVLPGSNSKTFDVILKRSEIYFVTVRSERTNFTKRIIID
jgi:hypothetical protein